MQDTLPLILRMLDSEELAEWSAHTPTTLDYLAQYKDGVDKMQFELGASGTGVNLRPVVYVPQTAGGGAETEPAVGVFYGTRSQKYVSYPNNVLAFDMNRPAGSSHYHKPRASYVPNRIFGGTLDAPREVRMTDQTVFVEFTVTDPFLQSPFVFGRANHQGFYGISNLTFNFTFTPDASRAFRSVRWSNNPVGGVVGANPYESKKARIANVSDSQLTMMFLTAHPSLSLSSRNVVPYYE